MTIPYAAGEPLTCQQLRELDILAIEHVGIPGLVLMENAAGAVAEFVYSTLINPRAARVLLLCGPGANGGDGFAVARKLRNAGAQVAVALATPAERIHGDAAINLGIYRRLEEPLMDASTVAGMLAARDALRDADVVIDALLGTGASGPPRAAMAELIEAANAASRARRVAIDIPTGLNADSGAVEAHCFRADATVTFVAEKIGFATPAAREVLGRVVVVDIGVPLELIPGRRGR